jgi:hypothetical protein
MCICSEFETIYSALRRDITCEPDTMIHAVLIFNTHGKSFDFDPEPSETETETMTETRLQLRLQIRLQLSPS